MVLFVVTIHHLYCIFCLFIIEFLFQGIQFRLVGSFQNSFPNKAILKELIQSGGGIVIDSDLIENENENEKKEYAFIIVVIYIVIRIKVLY